MKIVQFIGGQCSISAFNNGRKFKICYDILFGVNIRLSKNIWSRIRLEEGLDVIDREPIQGGFSVKNRAFHFSLFYNL